MLQLYRLIVCAISVSASLFGSDQKYPLPLVAEIVSVTHMENGELLVSGEYSYDKFWGISSSLLIQTTSSSGQITQVRPREKSNFIIQVIGKNNTIIQESPIYIEDRVFSGALMPDRHVKYWLSYIKCNSDATGYIIRDQDKVYTNVIWDSSCKITSHAAITAEMRLEKLRSNDFVLTDSINDEEIPNVFNTFTAKLVFKNRPSLLICNWILPNNIVSDYFQSYQGEIIKWRFRSTETPLVQIIDISIINGFDSFTYKVRLKIPSKD